MAHLKQPEHKALMPGGRQALKAAELCLLQPLGKASPARPHLATLCRGQKFCDGFWLQATSGTGTLPSQVQSTTHHVALLEKMAILQGMLLVSNGPW